MVSVSGERLKTADESVAKAQPMYDKAVKIATEADTIMTKPELKQFVVNTALAKAMIKANSAYPDLYDSVKPYIPRFFRITALSATPLDGTTCTVNMTGIVKNAQEYMDVCLALLRIPGATSVTRSGFQKEDVVVPSLVAIDNTGRPRLESKGPIPDDALDRLTYYSNESVPTGYLNSGNYGDLNPGVTKTIRPGESLITVSVTIPRNIQVPNPRATIQGLAGSGTGTTGGGAPQMTPTSSGGGANPGSNPSTPSTPASAGGGKGKAAAGDE